MNATQHISQEDLTLYSMQALTPAENTEVQAHLSTCAACRNTLSEVLTDVSLVGLSAPQEAIPEGARQRFLATIANTPQVSSAVADSMPVPTRIPANHRRRTGLGWFGWVTAIAAIAVAFYLGNHSLVLQRQFDEDREQVSRLSAEAARAQDLMEALTSPQAKQVTLTETKQPARPVGHATYLPTRGALVFVASNLRPVPQGKTYELWLIPANGKAPMPAGLFRPDATGSASVVLPPLPEGVEAKAFGVTIEEAQGSATPTLPIVMAGQ